MRIITLNCNGIRSAAGKGLFEWLPAQRADVVCLQETKAQEHQLIDACFRPGDWSSIGGVIGESVGGLHFAGEHCAVEAQGFMEGGCESGELAAQAILLQRGVALQPR